VKRQKREDVGPIEVVNAFTIIALILIAPALFFYQLYYSMDAINSLIVTLNQEGYSKQTFTIYQYDYERPNHMVDAPSSEFWGKVNGKNEAMSGFIEGYMPPELEAIIAGKGERITIEEGLSIDVWYNPDVGWDFRFGYETIRIVPYFKEFLASREQMLKQYCFRWLAFFSILLVLHLCLRLNNYYDRKSGSAPRP
jgi:hypothetical protein